MKEELSIHIEVSRTIFIMSYIIKRDSQQIELNFFLCSKWVKEIYPNEKQKILWVFFHDIKNHKMLVSNKKIVLFFETIFDFPSKR